MICVSFYGIQIIKTLFFVLFFSEVYCCNNHECMLLQKYNMLHEKYIPAYRNHLSIENIALIKRQIRSKYTK